MMELDSVVVNAQVVEVALEYLTSPTESLLSELASCTAAKKTYAHALRFGNTEASLLDFWLTILTEATRHQPDYEKHIQCNLRYLQSNRGSLLNAIQELKKYLPSDYSLQTHLNLILGYDVGIVSQGEAMLNIAHPHFSSDRRELVYMAMHELHHVGYTDYHPIYSLADLQTVADLRDAMRYSTHLEGLAVYAPMDRRISENGLGHEDYHLLLDSDRRQARVTEYFKILEGLDEVGSRELTDLDFEVMEKMSSTGNRLWYVAGAHMSETIDENLGREMLTQTIVGGPDSFFDAYKKAKNVG